MGMTNAPRIAVPSSRERRTVLRPACGWSYDINPAIYSKQGARESRYLSVETIRIGEQRACVNGEHVYDSMPSSLLS